MPRPRKPTELLELSGAFDKNPNRRRPSAPKSNHPLGRPPSYFMADEKDCWKELLASSVPGVITAADRIIVEMACLMLAKMRRREEMRGSDLTTLIQAVSKLGLTPVDRTKLSAPENDDVTASPFAEFAITAH